MSNATPFACDRLIHQPLASVLVLDGFHLTGQRQPYKRQSTSVQVETRPLCRATDVHAWLALYLFLLYFLLIHLLLLLHLLHLLLLHPSSSTLLHHHLLLLLLHHLSPVHLLFALLLLHRLLFLFLHMSDVVCSERYLQVRADLQSVCLEALTERTPDGLLLLLLHLLGAV